MATELFKQILLTICMICTFGLLACDSELSQSDLQNGDLLFTGPLMPNKENLSTAIDAVTQTQLATNYTHMGMVEKKKDQILVIHAAPKKGVCRQSLDQFLESRHEAAVYRLKDPYQAFIPNALKKARKLVGQPYDSTYVIGGKAHYCSGLLYTIFEPHPIFALEPMTFKNPATGEFHPIWVEHYAAMGMAIPEGLPGCNPNGMAASPHLKKMGLIRN